MVRRLRRGCAPRIPRPRCDYSPGGVKRFSTPAHVRCEIRLRAQLACSEQKRLIQAEFSSHIPSWTKVHRRLQVWRTLRELTLSRKGHVELARPKCCLFTLNLVQQI